MAQHQERIMSPQCGAWTKGLIVRRGAAAMTPCLGRFRVRGRPGAFLGAGAPMLHSRRARPPARPPRLARPLRARNGGNCWNDYGPPTIALPGEVQGYVIEFGTWATASDNNFTDFYEASVTHSILAGPASVPNSSGAVESGLAGVAANCDTPSSAYMNTTLTSNALKAGAL